jgi:hypothetical protein
MADTIADLLHANLLEVFNERDDAARQAAGARIYAEDIVWTDDDGVSRGRAALDARAVALQAKLGDLQFVYQTLGAGVLAFHLVAPGSDEPVVSGLDVAIVRSDVIVELYTVLTKPPG